MTFRRIFGFDSSLPGREWQLPILLPALLAGTLVVALAVQSVRAVQTHRLVVENSLRDYAAFAAWQYARRSSDYLRLVITATFPFSTATTGSLAAPAACGSDDPKTLESCSYPLAVDGFIRCTMSRGGISVTRNQTTYPSATIVATLRAALTSGGHSGMRLGAAAIPGADGRYLAYWLRPGACDAMVFGREALVPILAHTAGFAPLLPPTITGNLPNDSLVSIRVLSAAGTELAAMGPRISGMTAADSLGPDLGGIRAEVTLHPAAIARLTAGGVPESNVGALVGMLIVTLLLCAVAIWQLRRSQEIIRLRGNFVAAVSHELKTPLTQISLFADTLASRERTAAERHQYLGIISRESKRLGQLVDSILHFARISREGTGQPREPSLLGEEVGAAVAAFEPVAASRAAKITVAATDEIELPLDRDAFRQLMINVLDNALKFGPGGQTIAVSLARDGSHARIRVQDQGPGIPVEDRKRVFDAFVRADRSGRKAGTGIGLAVVKDVASTHGGTVSIGTSAGGGAVIEIDLPLR